MMRFTLFSALSFLISWQVLAVDKIINIQLSPNEQIQVLWEEYINEDLEPIQFFTNTENINIESLSIINQLRLKKMQNSFSHFKNLSKLVISETFTWEDALQLASEWIFVGDLVGQISNKNKSLIEKAKKYLESISVFQAKSKEEIEDLVYHGPDFAHYNNGEYKDSLKLFLFCRHDRHYPCLFVLKDIFNNLVRNNDGSVWSLPALAHSRRELPYNITNGYTPSGVHTMDSVMPEADRPQAFGQWRRVALNWIPKSSLDVDTMSFLPASAHAKYWWKEASVARDVGRQWLRIHGTGNRNTDRQSTFYPHYATSGCVSTREMEYDGVEYKDQRTLLDKLMESMQLAPIYNNETQIKGVLYVIELDDNKEKVTVETLSEFGIE